MDRFGDIFERMSPGLGGRKQEHYSNFAHTGSISANHQENVAIVRLPDQNAIGKYPVAKSNEKLTPDRAETVRRAFKAALVHYLINLIKPSWKDGKISKNTHKIIIKKAADKVVQSFGEAAQFPSDPKQIKHYLECSHSKLCNLIQAYVQKYQKK